MAAQVLATGAGDPLLALVGILLTGGLVTAWVAYKRAGPQNTLDTVQSIKILADELRSELDRANVKMRALEDAVAACGAERELWKRRAIDSGWHEAT